MLCQPDFPNKPFRQFPKTQKPIIPAFHHSNWGEAPKFCQQGFLLYLLGIRLRLNKKPMVKFQGVEN